MGEASIHRANVRLSFAVSKAMSNSGRAQLGYGLLEAVTAVLVVAEHVKAREARAENDIAPGGRGTRRQANRLVDARALRMGNPALLEGRREGRAGLPDEDRVGDARGYPAHKPREVPALGPAARDQHDRGPEAGKRGLDGGEIGGL